MIKNTTHNLQQLFFHLHEYKTSWIKNTRAGAKKKKKSLLEICNDKKGSRAKIGWESLKWVVTGCGSDRHVWVNGGEI